MATLFYKSRGGCIAIPLRGQDTELLRQHRLQQEAERTLLGIDLKEEDLVFARYDGSPLDPGTVYHTLRDILEQVGIPHIRFHDLRHTHATLLLQAGVHPKIVQECLGHSSITVTLDTYRHVVPGLQEMAARRIEVAMGDDAFEELGAEFGTRIVSAELCRQDVGKIGDLECEPRRTQTSNRLIKRLKKFILLLFKR